MRLMHLFSGIVWLGMIACGPRINRISYAGSAQTRGYATDSLPPPGATPSVKNFSMVTGWPEGLTPIAPAGFSVNLFASELDHPRWLYVLPNFSGIRTGMVIMKPGLSFWKT
jgi:glucose/arabinose dehydrogenase